MGEVQHILTAAPFTPKNMEPFFERASELRKLDSDPAERRNLARKFIGSRAINLFYAESTRTRVSFEMAEVALGVKYSTTPNARYFSSAAKGETFEHTIGVISEYKPDFVVLRYDQLGGADIAAAASDVPIINAGDGSGEHPTQAYLDAYTIWEQFGRLDNLRVAFMGDLRFGRTVRSLIHVLSKGQNNHFDFIAHPRYRLSDDIAELLSAVPGVTFEEHSEVSALQDVLPTSDAFYVTRTQTNLGAEKTETNEFRVTEAVADLMPEHSIMLHPMPIDRVQEELSEIDPKVDTHPRAWFMRQAGNGMYVRAALIEAILEGRSIVG